MKKLVTAACALAAGLALADGVTSSNIVGYNTEEGITRNTFTAIGVQFVNVTNCSTRAVPVKDLLDITNPRAGSAVNNNVDQIHVWNGSNWNIYYNQTGVGFVKSDAADKTVPTTDTVDAGDGVFFRRANYNRNADVTESGAVFDGETVSYTLSRNTFKFIAYPWPASFAVTNFLSCMTNPRAGSAVNNNVDQVHIWNGSNWNIYYNQTGIGFVKSDAADKTVPTTDVIEPGVCVFFRRANYNRDAVITFTKPEGL